MEPDKEMPEGYEPPVVGTQKKLIVGEYEFLYGLDETTGLVNYTVHDPYENQTESHTCTVNQFECALSAMCDDMGLSTSEYEEAERALGPKVRWIP